MTRPPVRPKTSSATQKAQSERLCRGGRKLKLVHQEGKNAKGVKGEEGCGIACVAMIAGVCYADAKARAGSHWEPNGTMVEELRSELASYGFPCDPKRPIGSKDYKTFGFDAVLRGELGGEWHWAVWDGCERKLLDPYKPGGKFRCTSYIRVHTDPDEA